MIAAPLDTVRHSAAHVLAQAIQRVFGSVKLGIGPSIDTGFYYDVDLDHSITEDDLIKIESAMRDIIQEDQSFSSYTMNRDAAIQYFLDQDQPYKVAIIRDLPDDTVTFYKNGPFVDLCRGPHIDRTSQIGVIKLLNVSGAYWRGSEKNAMLQRIYGTAFLTQDELDAHLIMLEEAKARDHRKIGSALRLFSISDEIGGGLVLWHPNGAAVRTVIEQHWRDQHQRNGYDIVFSPHVGCADLWKKSGHLDFYEDNMFSSVQLDSTPYYLRPMNCPFHIAMYRQQRWSYRDLPIRYAELGTVYRYERSGVLHGLMRVRGFTQDDAHIFCTRDTVKEEVIRVLDFSFSMLKSFGFTDYELFLSTRPTEKFVGDVADWAVAEAALTDALESKGLPFQVDNGGGAFYGPKIDIKINDAIGRAWQCSTIQFDFNLPQAFDLFYINSSGEKARPYMIHRALLGSIERFFGILIEHYAGRFPLWLAPVQLRILQLSDDAREFVRLVESRCLSQLIRVEVDDSNEKLGYKIRKANTEKIPLIGIVGKKEWAQERITIRQHGSDDQHVYDIDALIQHIKDCSTGGLQ